MNNEDIIENFKTELEKVLNFFLREVQKVRGARANPGLVEDIIVDCFGSKLPLKTLAAISCNPPRQIIIQPFSEDYLEPIEKALIQADLGTSPAREGQIIRLNLPSLSEEFREKLKKRINQIGEEARQTIRRQRDECWKEIQGKFRAGEISEDEKFRKKDRLQELVDEYNQKIEEVSQKKKEEIME
jgi:ribosome recycling factor